VLLARLQASQQVRMVSHGRLAKEGVGLTRRLSSVCHSCTYMGPVQLCHERKALDYFNTAAPVRLERLHARRPHEQKNAL
jgi:hypothetical protein